MANKYKVFSHSTLPDATTTTTYPLKATPLKPLNDTSGSVLNSLSKSNANAKKSRAKAYNGWSMPALWGKSMAAAAPPTVSGNDTVKAGNVVYIVPPSNQNHAPNAPPEELTESSDDASHVKDNMQAEIGRRRRRSAFTTLQNILTHPAASSRTSTSTTTSQPPTPTNIITFDSISGSVSLSAITSQVCGGPLERIVKKPESVNSKRYSIDLHFLQNDQAVMFYNYAKSGRFVINGQMYLPKIPAESITQARDRKILRSMVVDKARRCVILTWNSHYQFVSQYQRQPLYAHEEKNDKKNMRPVLFYHEHPMIIHRGKGQENNNNASSRLSQQQGLPFVIRNNPNSNNNPLKQPQPSLPRQFTNLHRPPTRNPKTIENGNPFNISLDITLEEIEQCFETLGEIVSIMPMIKTLPTICIQYSDVRSAIEACRIFNKSENPDPIWSKYFDKWSLQYGIDPCERTCPPSA